ncbi:endonuclease/exonuclease/phosphatase family protein [Streptomyces sp. NPDC012769]|uniref:endonuclease/exonuclease/phosphatase family protein n=1 Tax=Streptomyces sp. NPDC012769 TaxID=3364848 RepID=UPI0036925E6A
MAFGRRKGAAGGLLAVGAVVASLVGAPQTVAEEVPTAPKPVLRVISWNICGEAGGARTQTGYCPRRNDVAAKVAAVASLARQHRADVLLLQETCGYGDGDVPENKASSHLAHLETTLGTEGWQFAFAKGNRPEKRPGGETVYNSDCRGAVGGDVGVVLGVKGTLKDVQRFDTMPKDDPTIASAYANRVLPALCGRLEGWPDKVCSTHLIPGDGAEAAENARAKQSARIRSTLKDDFAKGLVIGGDLNARETSSSLADFTAQPGGLHRYTSDEHTRQSWPLGQRDPSRSRRAACGCTRGTAPATTVHRSPSTRRSSGPAPP